MSAALTPARAEAGFWLILCAGLAAGIGVESDWGTKFRWPVADSTAPPASFSRPVLAEAFRLPHPDQFLEVTLRPLFVVTRRPAPVAPPPEPPRPSMKRDQFVLMGTTIVPEGKFAFLLEKAGNKSRVVAEGKEINGIMVKEVGPDQVVLTQHGDVEVLPLKSNKPAAGAPAAAAGPGPRLMPAPPVPGGAGSTR